MTYREVI